MTKRYKYLKDFTFSNCYIRTSSIIAFTAQKWLDSDPLEQRETAIFFYYPNKPIERKWAVVGIGHATGVNGCAVFLPEERWVFVTDDGEVYIVGKGDNDYESHISDIPNLFFSNVKSIRKGHAIAVGPKRLVYRRDSPNTWQQLSNGLYPQGESTDLEYSGFRDIDGFSEQDVYACGGRGDAWHYDGKLWTRIDIPVNSSLNNICCADDGYVYITTNRREILKGKMDDWKVITQDITEEIFESIICFDGHVIVSTVSDLYEIVGNKFMKWNINAPKMKSYAHLAEGDGIFVVSGSDEVNMYDGYSWIGIL